MNFCVCLNSKLFSDTSLSPTSTGVGHICSCKQVDILSAHVFLLWCWGGWLLFASQWSIEPLDKCNVSGE